jgi:deoxyribose-phosphate aldolase
MTQALPSSEAELARYIDHTVLKPETMQVDIERLCDEAREHGFAAVCVNPVWVPLAVERLGGTETAVATVAGFPLGASVSETKADEARRAVEAGAGEVDMVVNLGALRAGDREAVTQDIAAVVAATKAARADAVVKVILETAALDEAQIVLGCRSVAEAQADYVKTSTGFHPAGGATVEHVLLLHRHAAPIKVKAAGGIRDLDTALAMIEAGAARLGTSGSVPLLAAMAQRTAGDSSAAGGE